MPLSVLIPLTLIGFLGLGLLWYRVILPIAESVRPADGEILNHPMPAPDAPRAPMDPPPAPAPAAATDDLGGRLRDAHTRAALLDVLLLAGWDTTEIRDVLRGDNNAKVEEIEAARAQLGLAKPAREILVYAGRPEQRAIRYDDSAMEPLP